ncbi:hypothetical protein MASR1M48_16560 [Lactococcus petauri]
MIDLKEQENRIFYESIWDMVYLKETDVLIVYCTGEDGPRKVEYKGSTCQKFYNDYVLYLSKKTDPSERITPLERKDDHGVYCYQTERANIRKTMTVEELARDDKYHEYGHLFLSELASLQHNCAKIEKQIKIRSKEVVGKLQVLMDTTDMVQKISQSDLNAIKSVIQDSIEVSKLVKRVDTTTLTILSRWMA